MRRLLQQLLQGVLGTAGKTLGNFKEEHVDVEREAVEDVARGRELLVRAQLHKN